MTTIMITINATSTQVCLLSAMEQTESTVEMYSLRLSYHFYQNNFCF